MPTYYKPGKRLNEIVIAGSHDAGITGGKSNIQTQSLNIKEQAGVGVRVFDLRIAAQGSDDKFVPITTDEITDYHKVAELKAFHADKKLMKSKTKERFVLGFNQPMDLEVTKLKGGDFGMGLTDMLRQAREFVETKEGSTEFLILKFDKCLNWALIASACVNLLGDRMYKQRGNVNMKTLDDLMRQVIVLFSSEGLAALEAKFGQNSVRNSGILGFTNLSEDKKGYSDDYNGLQYFGKGGTNPFNPIGKKKQNVKKQKKLMKGGMSLVDPRAMGMMYWTTTGLLESIEKRDERMWNSPNTERLKLLMQGGMGEFIQVRDPHSHIDLDDSKSKKGTGWKQFIPNIIMIDFANEFKCDIIHGLNDMASDSGVNLDSF